MLSLREITQQLSPEEYAALTEKVYADGYSEFGVERVSKNSRAHSQPIVIVRVDGHAKTYYL